MTGELISPSDLFVLALQIRQVLRSPLPPIKPSSYTLLFYNAYTMHGAGACIHTHSQNALIGNTVLSNYVAYDIMREAGIPDGAMRFVPGDAVAMTKQGFEHPEFVSLYFTRSSHVFKNMWRQIAENIDRYKSHPCIVGEMGGKNYHLVHSSANMDNAVNGTIR
ncbi:1-pyrroline-5-carboxylate dehydrogenase, partial [Coemansia furcata]